MELIKTVYKYLRDRALWKFNFLILIFSPNFFQAPIKINLLSKAKTTFAFQKYDQSN